MATTTFARLAGIVPHSETQWREIAALAHRSRNRSGDEAAAKTHELHIWEIREGLLEGSTRGFRFCPKCLEKGRKYALLFIADSERCGTCNWTSPDKET